MGIKNREDDARGRSVTILDPVAMHLLRPVTATLLNRPEVIPRSTLRRLAEDIDAKGIKQWRRAPLCVIIMTALSTGWSFASQSTGSASILVPSIIPPAFFTIFLLVDWQWSKRARRPRVISAMLRYRRCPHCGYDIRDLPTDPADNATVCPECGSAWRIDCSPIEED